MSDAEALTEATEALRSAMELVSELEKRVDQLSFGKYSELQQIAEFVHFDECGQDHGRDLDQCQWYAEQGQPEPWFCQVHQRWLESAYRWTRRSGAEADELLAAMKLFHRARGSR